MRELEKREENQWVGTRTKRKDVPFIRTAAAGSWKSLLSRDDVAKIENEWAPIMAALGYEITTEPEDADNSQVLPFLLHSRAGGS